MNRCSTVLGGGLRAALVCASAVSTGVVPSASATGRAQVVSRVVLQDPEGDVWVSDTRDEDDGAVPVQSRLTTADLVRAVARHTRRAVVVRLAYVDLRRWGDSQQQYAIVRTDQSRYDVVLRSTKQHRRGRLSVMAMGAPHFGSSIPCAGARHQIAYAEDQVTMRVPRRCLGQPRWAKLNVKHRSFVDKPADLIGEHYVVYADNPHNSEPDADGTFTRRLYPR